jgi:Ca-activated chloride channel family protein
MKHILFLFGLATLLTATQSSTQLETFTLTGIVVDGDTGDPLIGANVLIKGTAKGTVTDLTGKFELKSPWECAELEINYTGYATQTAQACAGQEIRVELKASMILDEVVVTGGRPRIREHRTELAAKMMAPSASSTAGIIPPGYYRDATENWNTDDYDVINENRFYAADQTPLSTFSIDVDAASYSNMRRYLKNGQQPPKDAIRIEELLNYFSYDYPEPQGEHPFELITELSDCPWQPGHKLLHIGLQGQHIPRENLPPSNLVFLIDVSGSMEAPNRLPLLQASFKLLVNQLRAQDQVAIVVYAGSAGLVLEPTSGADKQKIRDAIDRLRAGGSTAGGAGIQLAYKVARDNFIKDGNNRVILATDGDFNVGASSDAELVRLIEKERESGVFLTVLGYGMGNYKDNKMQKLANAGNGNHAYIDDISEANKVLVNEFGGTIYTIAKDVKLQIEFNPAQVRGYRLIGYENRLLNKEDFNDDKKDAGELGAGHTVTALYEIIPAGVESAYLPMVDELKYQQPTKLKPDASKSKELCTLKLRYKAPDGNASKLLERPVLDKGTKLDRSSDDFRWSAAVATFGMLLRDSEFKGEATYAQAVQLARSAQGKDPHGYRREFIQMAELMKGLAAPDTAGRD